MVMVAVAVDDGSGFGAALRVSGGVAPYTWTAYPAGGGAPWTVRPLGDGSAVFDGAAPLGTTVTYHAMDSTGAIADTDPLTFGAAQGFAVLSDALDPTRYVTCTVVDQLPSTWDARSVWFDVIDRPDPFVALAPMRLRAGSLVIHRTGTDERQTLLDLLRPGTPLRLRSSTPDAVDDEILLPLRVAESLLVDDDKAGARLFTIDYQAVTGDLGPYVSDPLWTWADLDADPRTATWAQVTLGYLTYADLLTGIRAP